MLKIRVRSVFMIAAEDSLGEVSDYGEEIAARNVAGPK
jgi:hypothetical protein